MWTVVTNSDTTHSLLLNLSLGTEQRIPYMCSTNNNLHMHVHVHVHVHNYGAHVHVPKYIDYMYTRIALGPGQKTIAIFYFKQDMNKYKFGGMATPT